MLITSAKRMIAVLHLAASAIRRHDTHVYCQ